MRFYLGTHMPSWLKRVEIPLFVSRTRLTRYKRELPRALGPWALDSGGFTELSQHGTWTISPRRYVSEVWRYADSIGNMDWAAIQDWMCEPHILAKTGLTVEEHQKRTLENFLELRDLAPELPWVPVLQGWEPEDYLRHVDMYDQKGVDLTQLDVVGIGSVCRRQHTDEAEEVIRRLDGISLHGFGFKVTGLTRVGHLLESADSMAWSFAARRRQIQLAGCTHACCANCLRWARLWRRRMLRKLGKPTDQKALVARFKTVLADAG